MEPGGHVPGAAQGCLQAAPHTVPTVSCAPVPFLALRPAMLPVALPGAQSDWGQDGAVQGPTTQPTGWSRAGLTSRAQASLATSPCGPGSREPSTERRPKRGCLPGRRGQRPSSLRGSQEHILQTPSQGPRTGGKRNFNTCKSAPAWCFYCITNTQNDWGLKARR